MRTQTGSKASVVDVGTLVVAVHAVGYDSGLLQWVVVVVHLTVDSLVGIRIGWRLVVITTSCVM